MYFDVLWGSGKGMSWYRDLRRIIGHSRMNDEIRTVLVRSGGLRFGKGVEIGCRYPELSNDKAYRLYRGMTGHEKLP